MEESLTDCLVRVREDLTNLNQVRDFLEKNGEREEECSITWRTIEAFNSILTTFSSQDTPQTNTLDTLLDSFYFLARNNTDPRVWHDFGFEIGIISGKILSAIDRSDIFDILFWKLLTIINLITEHDSTVWKSSARQILNIFINKKFSHSYFETVLKLYINILRNVENFSLANFSTQNLHLLKTFSNLVPRIGDFEIQSDIIELVFLHLSEKTESMLDFFTAGEKKLFDSLSFRDFERDTRTYLNAINKPGKGFERKIFSISCEMLYFGGCFVEPPIGGTFLWVDANKDTERLSIRCADVNSNSNRVIYIKFSDITKINLSNDKTGVNCFTIQTKSLWGLQFDVKNNEICLMTKNSENLTEFASFLNGEIKKRQKTERKLSKTRNSLFIDRSKMKELQDNAITSSENQKTDKILSDITNLFEKTDSAERQIKTSQSSKSFKIEIKSPGRSQDRTTVVELSPNSFVESLNQHIGRESSEFSHNFEDSVETIEFLQKNHGHRLFRTPEKLFDVTNSGKHKNKQNFSFIFDEGKENEPIVDTFRQKLKTYERKREPKKSPKPFENSPAEKVMKNRKILETPSQEYFKQNLLTKNKPSLPKFKRKLKEKSHDSKKQDKDETSVQKVTQSDENKKKELKKQEKHEMSVQNIKQSDKNKMKNCTKLKEDQMTNQKQQKGSKTEEKKTQQTKPSLLDPNSYTFKRWCEPTTSERSNFWLKKLQNSNTKKSKRENQTTFDFSEDSDSISTKTKRKKRKVIHSKRKPKPKDTRQTSLKEVREILKKKSPPRIKPRDTYHEEDFLGFSPRKEPEIASRRSSTPESIEKNGNETNEDESVTKEEENGREEENLREDEENLREDEENVAKEEKMKKKDGISREAEETKVSKEEEKWRKDKEKVRKKEGNVGEEEEQAKVRKDTEIVTKEDEDISEEENMTEEEENETKEEQKMIKYKQKMRKKEENAREEDMTKKETKARKNKEKLRKEEEKLRNYKENTRKEENIKIKKRTKNYLLSGETMTSLQNRLLVKEKQNKQETDEILQTVTKSVNYLFNHIQRKEGKNVLSYLATAEETAAFVESSAADLKIRAKRIERAMLYFREGCSVSEMFHTLEGQLSEVRNSLNKMAKGEDNLRTINQVNDRLLSLIKSGIEKAIDKELATKREKLLKCASIFMGKNFP